MVTLFKNKPERDLMPATYLAQDPSKSGTKLWEKLDDEQLLKWRISDLKLKIDNSWVEPFIQRLYDELDAKGIQFHPACYLSTEWLCPDKTPLIGIPFCLAHERIMKLEKTMMLEVEGGTEEECMKLLRHEAGHALNYAYRLYRRSRWRDLFGPFSAEYNVQEYHPRPYSKQYVVHLEDHYAQAHPDEDFAETFAVWLTPDLDWRGKYSGWRALKKLEYIDHLMRLVGSHPPLISGGPKLWPVSSVRSTLHSYYKRKRREIADAYPGFYDPELLELFTQDLGNGNIKAHLFLNKHQRALTQSVSRWARVHKYTAEQIIRRLSRRAKELSLYLKDSEEQALLTVSVYFTSVVCEDRERDKHGQGKRDQR